MSFFDSYLKVDVFLIFVSCFLTLKNTKRVVSIKGHVGEKIVHEKLSMWTQLLETQEYSNTREKYTTFEIFVKSETSSVPYHFQLL